MWLLQSTLSSTWKTVCHKKPKAKAKDNRQTTKYRLSLFLMHVLMSHSTSSVYLHSLTQFSYEIEIGPDPVGRAMKEKKEWVKVKKKLSVFFSHKIFPSIFRTQKKFSLYCLYSVLSVLCTLYIVNPNKWVTWNSNTYIITSSYIRIIIYLFVHWQTTGIIIIY